MPDVVSRIRVIVTGDAKGLTTAMTAADRSIGGTVKNLAVAGGALFATKEAIEFLGDSNVEFDRLEDATTRLELQLGTLSAPIIATSGDFAKLGQSKQDILELAASFADIGTKAGIADPLLASNASEVAAIAAAASLLGDQDAATIVENIAKAAGGATKPLGDLGVNVDEAAVAALALTNTGKTSADALTDNELAAARLTIIMEQLRPKLDEVANSTGDVESKQRELGARVETLQAQLGEKLAPAMETVLGFLIDEIDAIPHAIQGFEMLGGAIEKMARDALGPVAALVDALQGLRGAPGVAGFDQNDVGRSERNTVRDQQDFDERSGNSRTVNHRVGGP